MVAALRAVAGFSLVAAGGRANRDKTRYYCSIAEGDRKGGRGEHYSRICNSSKLDET